MRPRSSTTAARIVWRSGSPLSRPASSRNQRSRSSHGTAAFAGEVEGRTKSFVSPKVPSCRPSSGRVPNAPRYASFPTKASQRGRSSRAIPSSRSAEPGEVAAPQVTRAGCRPVGSVRHADSLLEQGELLLGRVETGRQLSRVEQAPEVVARVREVCARFGRHATRVDADEDDPEIRSEDVGHLAGRRVPSGHVPGVNHSFPQWGSEAPFANGRRRAVTAGWQLCAGWLPRELRGLGRSLCRVELRHELVGPGLDARLEVAPQILTRHGQLVPRTSRLDLHQGHRRIPAAV